MKPLVITLLLFASCTNNNNPKTAQDIAVIQTQPIPDFDSLTPANNNTTLLADHPIEKALTNCLSSSAPAQCCQEYYEAWNKAVTDKYNVLYSKAINKTLLTQWHYQYTAAQKSYSDLLAEMNKDLGQSMQEDRLLQMGKSLKYQYDLLLDIENTVNN